MKKKYVLLAILVILIGVFIFKYLNKDKEIVLNHVDDSNFNSLFLKNTNQVAKNNFLISPYSVKIALSILRDGANNNTKDEINNLIGENQINVLNNKSVSIANSLFIKNKYKDGINNSYKNQIVSNYNSEILFDDFYSPKVINDWVKNKTNGMINKILDEMNEDFVLGIANALAIDVKWKYQFECNNTKKEKFTNKNNKKINVEMMHNTYSTEDVKYLESDNVKGIVIPYEDKDNLEFIALIPNGNIDNYIDNFSINEVNKMKENAIIASDNIHINLSLPRFKYDYNLEEFKNVLINMGIKDVFNEYKADLTNIMTRDNMEKYEINNLYVGEAIHKTHIDLNEVGTKAAAVTYFGIFKETSFFNPNEPKIINIEFNKTFLYMIVDKNTNEILFLGVVDNPTKWQGTTCSNK